MMRKFLAFLFLALALPVEAQFPKQQVWSIIFGSPSGSANPLTGTADFYHASSTFLTRIQPGNATGAATYTLPTAASGTNGFCLTSTTAGVMSWGQCAPANFTFTGPSTSRTYTFPDSDDTLVTLAASQAITSKTIATTATSTTANAVGLGFTAGCVRFEGSTADAVHTDLCTTDPTTGNQIFNLPNRAAVATDTLATLGATQSFTATNTFSGFLDTSTNAGIHFGNGQQSILTFITVLTPDGLMLGVPSSSNTLHVAEIADTGFDFQNPCTNAGGTSACTDPSLIIHSHNQSTTQFQTLSHDGKLAQQYGVNGLTAYGGKVALVESSASTFATVTIASNAFAAGVIEYTIHAEDASAHYQTRASSIKFAAQNVAGTTTCQLTTQDGTAGTTINETTDGDAVVINSGTLTYAITCADGGSGALQFKANAVSSLTQTVLDVYYRVHVNSPGSVTGG